MHNKLRNTNQAYQFEYTYSSKSARNLLTKDSISSLTIISKPLSPSYTSLSKDSSLFSLLLPILLDLHLKTPPSSQSLTEYTESTSTLSLIIPDKYTTTDLKYSISLLSTQPLPNDLSPLQLKMSLDLLSEIFNISEDVLTKICSDISLNITIGNCYEYFKLFYIDHICNNNNNNNNSNNYRKKQHNACSILGNNVKNSYYHEIILRAVEFAGENLVYYVNESTFGDNVNTNNTSVNAVNVNVNANIIKSLPNELIEEIFMQYFMNVQLVKGNNSVVYNSNRNNDKYVIKALMQFRDVYDNDDIFKLLEIEYQKAKMKFISYCANDKPVTFTLNACEHSWESECFYIAGEEYIISLNTLYDESKDEYTIGIKLHNDNNTTITTCPNANNTTINATILSLLALVEIPELQYKSKPCPITTVSNNNKSKILLVNIPKFTAALTSKGLTKQSTFTLVFHYDMSYNSSYLLTYIARNFSVNKYPSHPSLQNVDLVLLNTVLAFHELTVYNEDETLTAVITWLNYNQDVSLVKKLQLVNKINWNCVSIAKIIEFIMCHSKLITQCEDVKSVINKEIEDRINNALFVYDCSNNEMSTSNINNKNTTINVNVVNKRKYLSQKNYYYNSTTTNNSNNNSNSHNNIIINSNNNNYDSQNCSCSVIYNGMNYNNINTKNVKPIIDDIVQGIANVYDNIKETFIANTNINSNSGNNICNNCNSITNNNNNNNAMINMNNHHYTTIASTSNVQKYKNIHHKCNVNSPRGVVPSSFTYDLNHLVQLSTRVYNTNSGHNKSKNIKAQFCSGSNNKQFGHKGSLSPSSVNRNNNNQQMNMYKDGNKSKSLISDRKNNVKNGSAAAVQNVKSKHHYVSKSTGSNHKEGTKTVNANGSGKKLNVSKNYIKNKSPISYHEIAKKTTDGGNNNAKSGVICGVNGDKGKGGGVNGNQSNANTISVSSVSVSGNANVNVNNGQHHHTFNTSVKSMI